MTTSMDVGTLLAEEMSLLLDSIVLRHKCDHVIIMWEQGVEPPPIPESVQINAEGISIVEGEADANVILDWKGDPMKINPGDKMPFF